MRELPARRLVLQIFPEALNPHWVPVPLAWQTAPPVTHEFRGTNLLGVGVWPPKTLLP